MGTSKTARLEKLFTAWEAAQDSEPDNLWARTRNGKNITRSHFRRDGIVDEAVFAKEKRKVLFISNEANDDAYSASSDRKPSNTEAYREYYRTGHDDWKGKMRERTSALYKIVAGGGVHEMSDADAAVHYAVMDINKRGGQSSIDSAAIREYCKHYREFIRREIEIIDPDIVVWLGTKTYDMGLHTDYLGAKRSGDKVYFILGRKKVPVLRMWHTAYFQAKNEPLPGYANKTIGKLCAKCRDEMIRYDLLRP